MAEVPDMLDGAGLELWSKLNEELDFEPHDQQIALQLCRTVSLCEEAHRQLLAEGLVVEGQRGPKINPLMAELRQQRLIIARLTASLGIPPAEGDGPGKPRGAARGVYTPQPERS